MTTALHTVPAYKRTIYASSGTVTLDDGATTKIHVVRYDRASTLPKVVMFEEATYLSEWCQSEGVREAMSGGFFLRSCNKILGDTWVDGVACVTQAFESPWHMRRGTLHVGRDGVLTLGPRHELPDAPQGDMLQAGPLLVHKGKLLIADDCESEGFSAACHQFDSDITIGRYPRAAIACNEQYIWSIVCDGRSTTDAGLTLTELAHTGLTLGAQEVLNLDGGSQATQISSGQLRNSPRSDDNTYISGRPLYTALVFQSV
jgi:exopolysaccharide biosynthesis protein